MGMHWERAVISEEMEISVEPEPLFLLGLYL